jgi:hypothetical protein
MRSRVPEEIGGDTRLLREILVEKTAPLISVLRSRARRSAFPGDLRRLPTR